MATEASSMPRAPPHDSTAATHYHRRRPFSTWVKKLTNFKTSSRNSAQLTDAPAPDSTDRQSNRQSKAGSRSTRRGRGDSEARNQNQPAYSLRIDSNPPRPDRTPTGAADDDASDASPTTIGARSVASTFCTDRDGARSFAAPSGVTSLADTSRTTGGGPDSRRGGGSTFSSPSPSVRSLTTTLTTIQSLAPGAPGGPMANTNNGTHNPSIQYHQPFPTTPASAIPAHLVPTSSTPGHPTTYNTATANNLLTDNASILTLASSSKRRRRRSLDTDASVRALAPSSLWGGSRESLPLSILSANIDVSGGPTTPGLHPSGSSRMMSSLGTASAERASIYSPNATPTVPTLQSERSSFYARSGSGAVGGNGNGDGASVRSGYLGHGRADSINGGAAGPGGAVASPSDLAESREEA